MTEHKIWIVPGNLVDKVTKTTGVPQLHADSAYMYSTKECFPPFFSTSFRGMQEGGREKMNTLTEAPAMPKCHIER